MTKNIIIALLIGLLIGSNMPRASADAPSLSRADLYTAAALIGILANPDWSVKNTEPIWGTPSTAQLVNAHVNALLKSK